MLRTLLLALAIAIGSASAHDLPPPKQRDAVVSLTTPSGKPFCAGVAIEKHVVLTAKHCMDAAQRLGIQTHFNGSSCPFDRVIEDDGYDHVKVHTCREWKSPAKMVNYYPLKIGEQVVAYGHPDGLPLMFRRGYHTGVRYQDNDFLGLPIGATQWLFVIEGYKGDSGGPIFNSKGEVIAITSFGYNPVGTAFQLMGAYPLQFGN